MLVSWMCMEWYGKAKSSGTLKCLGILLFLWFCCMMVLFLFYMIGMFLFVCVFGAVFVCFCVFFGAVFVCFCVFLCVFGFEKIEMEKK